MDSSRFLLMFLSFILFVMIIMIPQTLAQSGYPAFLYNFCINDKGNYTANSTYQENLKTLLSSLPTSNGNGYGFYNLSYSGGESSEDRVYAIGLCRGDVQPDDCRSCLNDSSYALSEHCSNKKEAIGWYENCMFHYSNRSIYGITETRPTYYLGNTKNVSLSIVDGFNQALRKLLVSLQSEAASGGSLRKFAIGNASAPGSITIYALVQCTPDLLERDCNDCLDDAFGEIPSCCDGKIGGGLVRPSCNFRYENYSFFDATTVPPLPSPPLSPPISPQPSSTTPTGI